MPLDVAQTPTGQQYVSHDPGAQDPNSNGGNGSGEVSIDADVEEMETPERGNCAYYAVQRVYSSWIGSHPMASVPIYERLDNFCKRHTAADASANDQLVAPIRVDVPAEGGANETSHTEPLQVERWRKICAKQLELHWDRYDVPPTEGNEDALGADVDSTLSWLYHPGPNESRFEAEARSAATVAIKGALGADALPLEADVVRSESSNLRKLLMVEMVKTNNVWASGIELNALAEVLGLFISIWHVPNREVQDAWKTAKRLRIYGPYREEAIAIAEEQYKSEGRLPNFNLVQYAKHFSYQRVGVKAAYDTLNLYRTPIYGVGQVPIAVPGQPQTGGFLMPNVLGGNDGNGGGGGGGGKKTKAGEGEGNKGEGGRKKGDGGGTSGGGALGGGGRRGGAGDLFQGAKKFFTERDAPKFKPIDCATLKDEEGLTEQEWGYAQKRLKEAHLRFFEHWSSRTNYGKILLMTDSGATKVEQYVDRLTVHEAQAVAGKGKVKKVAERVSGIADKTVNTGKSKDMNRLAREWGQENASELDYNALMREVWQRLRNEEAAPLLAKGKEANTNADKENRAASQGHLLCLKIFKLLDLNQSPPSAEKRKTLWKAICRWWRRVEAKFPGDTADFKKKKKGGLVDITPWITTGLGPTGVSADKTSTMIGYLFKFLVEACRRLEAELGEPLDVEAFPDDEVCLPILLYTIFDADESGHSKDPCPE